MRRRRDGFTLIEMLLALAIGAMVMLTMYAVLVSSLAARRLVDEQGRAGRIHSALFGAVGRDLAAAFLYTDVEVGFVGKGKGDRGNRRDRLDFLTLSPGRYPKGEQSSVPTEVGYQLLTQEGTPYFRLYRREAFYADKQPARGGPLVPLVSGVFDLDFEYHDGERWQQTWVGKKSLPRQVRMTIGVYIGAGTPRTRDRDRERRFTQTFALPAEGFRLTLAPDTPTEGGEEGGGTESGAGANAGDGGGQNPPGPGG